MEETGVTGTVDALDAGKDFHFDLDTAHDVLHEFTAQRHRQTAERMATLTEEIRTLQHQISSLQLLSAMHEHVEPMRVFREPTAVIQRRAMEILDGRHADHSAGREPPSSYASAFSGPSLEVNVGDDGRARRIECHSGAERLGVSAKTAVEVEVEVEETAHSHAAMAVSRSRRYNDTISEGPAVNAATKGVREEGVNHIVPSSLSSALLTNNLSHHEPYAFSGTKAEPTRRDWWACVHRMLTKRREAEEGSDGDGVFAGPALQSLCLQANDVDLCAPCPVDPFLDATLAMWSQRLNSS